MNIVRLFVLGILFYIAWTLLKGIFNTGKSELDEGKNKSSGAASKVEDVLVEDPVCHTLVPKHQAIRFRSDGETHYFCSETCCDKFSDTLREGK